jgi:hypothetical protein
MPRSQPRGHRRRRAQARTLLRRRARERFRGQVAPEFLLKNSPRAWARQWTRSPDGEDPNVNTLFSTVRHGTACGAHFAVSP